MTYGMRLPAGSRHLFQQYLNLSVPGDKSRLGRSYDTFFALAASRNKFTPVDCRLSRHCRLAVKDLTSVLTLAINADEIFPPHPNI